MLGSIWNDPMHRNGKSYSMQAGCRRRDRVTPLITMLAMHGNGGISEMKSSITHADAPSQARSIDITGPCLSVPTDTL